MPVQETQEMRIQSLGQEDPLKKGMETYSCLEIPWTEETGGLQSMGVESDRGISGQAGW